jgi:hypothetical protein
MTCNHLMTTIIWIFEVQARCLYNKVIYFTGFCGSGVGGASNFSMQMAAPNSMELLISAVRWQHLRVNDRYSCGVGLDEPKNMPLCIGLSPVVYY